MSRLKQAGARVRQQIGTIRPRSAAFIQELLGWIAVVAYLFGYVLSTNKVIPVDGFSYPFINLVAGAIFLYLGYRKQYFQSVFTNAIFIGISVWALVFLVF